ncbi:hemerythrin domain-containing protein [Actinomadura sp. WMMA1423]|uniref:hemerythrin domain-containing protein n=1 Tax=Actinomadura sp. WMMA1423 TaxID=2591108 RepID=UPI001146D2A5|nr:hemerythrin domain-containing protein [Actinomadura sp. WMMA1423]
MSEGQKNRLIAWNRELTAAHQRLREALRLARRAVDAGDSADAAPASRELLLYCKGFCAALDGHHLSEDTALFPELAARHPALRPAIAKLQQDHERIASLLAQFDHALSAGDPPDVLASHLAGLAAIMESHFQYEERQLLGPLAALELDAHPHALLGPL